jgi:hypothetical protein
VRRIALSSTVLLTLALPASVQATRSVWVYNPHPFVSVSLKLKPTKKTIFGVGVDPGVPLQCDEGASEANYPFALGANQPRLKHRKFQVKTSKDFVYETIDESGLVVGRDKAPLQVTVSGRFKPSYHKVSGTLTITGSYYANGHAGTGPNGSDIQYHNCSARLHWAAPKSFETGGPIGLQKLR